MEQDIGLRQARDSKVLSPILCGEFQFVGQDLHFTGAQDFCEVRSQETTFEARVPSQVSERPFILEMLDGCDISALMHERSQVASILRLQRQSAKQ